MKVNHKIITNLQLGLLITVIKELYYKKQK